MKRAVNIFLNLEKRNNIKKHIRKLYLSGSFSTDSFEILNAEKLFYSKLYSRQRVNLNSERAESSFLENPNILKLSDELSSLCERKITFQECESILGAYQLGKPPGNDGIAIEFYKIFWPLIGEFLIASFNEAFDNKEMSSSQKQALITLFEKKGKDRNFIENWRPISLINVHAKIASKVIAARIIKVLREIIHTNQTGYVKDRFIGEAARSIKDVMEYTKQQNMPGILLFIDFEKAFDSIDWTFMLKCLDAFGFGPTIIRWVETLYNDITSCVLNNSISTPYFELQRGVRQGDPLSTYLFIIAAEILAVTIRSREDIRGIMIGQEEFKLVQYVDDLTLFVPNIECVKLILQLLDRFTFCSGLKVNHTKTEAMWIGSCRQNTATPLGLRWSKSVQALGIVFTYNDTDQLQENFYDKLKDIGTQIRL